MKSAAERSRGEVTGRQSGQGKGGQGRVDEEAGTEPTFAGGAGHGEGWALRGIAGLCSQDESAESPAELGLAAPLAGEEAEGARAETRPRPRACWLLNPGQANSRPRTTIRTLSPPGEGAALREGEAVLTRVGLGPCLLFSRPQAEGGVWAVEKALD